MRIWNSLTVPKNLKGRLWDFQTSSCKISKIEGGPLGEIKRIRKNSRFQAKNENFETVS